jgi:N-acetylmuramoyl-L-alanine amidase
VDRRTRRNHDARLRARRIQIGAVVAVAAAALAVLLTSTLGGAQEAAKPTPAVDAVDLTPAPEPVGSGWEGQVATDANLVAVEWKGDQSASYTFETRDGAGNWKRVAESEVFDNGPDPGTQDAGRGATPDTKQVTEPVWVGRNVSGVRVRLEDGSAQDVTLHVIDSTRGKKPETNVESAGSPATPTEPTETSAPAPPPRDPPPSDGGSGDVGDATTATTTPVRQGIGPTEGLAVAALATLVIAFVMRRRRVLAIVAAAVIMLAACAPTKDGGGGSARPIPDAIVARSSWAPDLPWNWDACPGGPEYAYVGTAIVHHTVNSNAYGPGDSVGIMRGIWAYHVQSLGYCDIAYNFIIDNYGTPFEGRLGGIDQPVIGAHSLGANTGTTGIAMLGTFSSVTPSNGALGTLENLIRWKLYIHGANPFDDPAADILAHRDVYSTECPGDALYSYLPYTRHYVKAYW